MSSTSILAYIVLTISIGYAFIYSPMGEISSLMDKKQQYEQTLQTVSNIENTKQALLTKFNKISDADKQNINTILPNSFNFTKLISQIDTVAESYGIAIKDVTSQDMNPTAGSSIADAQPKSPYSSAVIGFSFSAPYNKFSGFLNDLEKSTRILDINSLQLKVDEKGNDEYQVQFVTYWLN